MIIQMTNFCEAHRGFGWDGGGGGVKVKIHTFFNIKNRNSLGTL